MFIKAELSKEYYITATKEAAHIAVEIWKNQTLIGSAHLITDNVDVSCFTAIHIDNEHVNLKFNHEFTLAEIAVKFLMKFPTMVRRPEFRFILEVPDNLRETISQHNFDRGEGSNFKNEVLIRSKNILPEARKPPEHTVFKESVEDKDLPNLLLFLKKNAYWQVHLTLERLKLIVDASHCFFALSDTGQIVGFSRVLTNNASFASLWDVVVDDQHRGKGIGMTLMFNIFTNETLKNIGAWILFTDTAKSLYQKFGFVAEDEMPHRKLVHKLRLQDSPPTYMPELIQAVSNKKLFFLNTEQTFEFLFSQQGKRANLPSFWAKTPSHSYSDKALRCVK